jgi:hypothetical protein
MRKSASGAVGSLDLAVKTQKIELACQHIMAIVNMQMERDLRVDMVN